MDRALLDCEPQGGSAGDQPDQAGSAGSATKESGMGRDSQDVLERIDSEKESYLEELKDFIRIPSISTDPDYKGEVRRAAEFLLGKLESAGLTGELIETTGHPLVYAEWLGAAGA